MDALVSVVMPVYNAENYIADSVNDILSQTMGDLELICVDDGSTDKSGRFLDEVALSDDRVRVIHQNNAGGGIARNVGLDNANGKYILFLDADDRFEKDMLEKAVARAEENDCEILAFNADTFDNESGIVKSAPWLILKECDQIEDNPFDVLNTTVWNKMFLRNFILEHGIRFLDNRYSDTMYFTAVALLESKKTSVFNKIFIHYRVNNKGSVIARQDKDYMAVYRNLECIRERIITGNRLGQLYFYRLAENTLVARIKLMRTKEAYFSLYNMLHDGGLKRLGFEKEDDFSDTKEGRRLKEIFEKNIVDDLLDYREKLLEARVINFETFGLPSIAMKSKKATNIVLYGAGNVGRDYFHQIMSRSDMNMKAWVDKNYDRIGFPVTAPESILDIEYDIVLVATIDEKNVKYIKKDLETIGIDSLKIVWKEPIII